MVSAKLQLLSRRAATRALVSIVTGLTFGSYPALRASRLSPIEAIRHE